MGSCIVSQLVQSLSRVRLFATPWTAARQASLSIILLVNVLFWVPGDHKMFFWDSVGIPGNFFWDGTSVCAPWLSRHCLSPRRLSSQLQLTGQTCTGPELMLLLVFSCSVMFNSFAIPWTVARQASLSMGFSRQEYWQFLVAISFSMGSFPGIEPTSPALAGGFFTTGPPGNWCLESGKKGWYRNLRRVPTRLSKGDLHD